MVSDHLRPYLLIATSTSLMWTGAICLADDPVEDRSPYAGQETRTLKSMSEDEVAAYLRGDGMGFAKLAELNSYPGPRHVLDLADQLDLSDEQLASTEALFEEMRQQAITLGEQLVAAETRLDRAFAAGDVDAASLEAAMLEIGEIRGRLRNVHLQAHLEQKGILTPMQVRRYDMFRGYNSADHEHKGHHGHTTK
ncbi:MAG: hypothetical protein P8X81_09860 [Woeseiaceae bacterium]